MGVPRALEYLGCDDPKDLRALLHCYARGFAEHVLEAIKLRDGFAA